MKHLMIAVVALLSSAFAFPQQQERPPKPPPLEKRWEKDSEKIKKVVTLTSDELTKMKAAFMTFYKEMDALHDKNKGQRPAKAEVEKVAGKRNEVIKRFLAKEKFDKFMKVEKELGPPKPKERPEGEQ